MCGLCLDHPLPHPSILAATALPAQLKASAPLLFTGCHCHRLSQSDGMQQQPAGVHTTAHNQPPYCVMTPPHSDNSVLGLRSSSLGMSRTSHDLSTSVVMCHRHCSFVWSICNLADAAQVHEVGILSATHTHTHSHSLRATCWHGQAGHADVWLSCARSSSTPSNGVER